MVLQQNNAMFNDQMASGNRGAKIALWGSLLSTIGDALQTVGGAISIEEGLIADAEQQRELDNLQRQIDELKKMQSPQNNTVTADVEMLDKLVEKLINRLDKDNDDKS